jgi:hypothetical protein
MARRLEAEDAAGRVGLAYRLAFGRAPAAAERADAAAFLNGAVNSAAFDLEAWTDFCHALLNSNEFLYID